MAIILVGQLDPISNRADWRVTSELKDNSGVLVDLTGAEIKLAVRDAKRFNNILSGDTTEGHVVIDSLGMFTFSFPASELVNVCAGQYDVGITIMLATGVTYQGFLGTVSVLDGVVR